jgi:hypothetical protein
MTNFTRTKHIKSNQSLSCKTNVRIGFYNTKQYGINQELALRWWDRLTIKEKIFYMKKYLPSFTEKNLTS